jgi:hypothetical protein
MHTGKTFRIICTALDSCSTGRPVVVVSSSEEESKAAMKAAVKMANTYLTPDFLTHAFGDKYMMANGGTLEFMTEEAFDERRESIKPASHILHDQSTP